MINLLPPEEKKNLIAEEQRKITLILGLVVLIFFVSFILVLVSVNFSMASQLKALNVTLTNKESQSQTSGVQTVDKEVSQANQSLVKLDSFYKQKVSMTAFLEKISGILPQGIYLENISVTPLGTGGGIFQVVLSGHAASIDNVLALNDKLKADQSFSQISFPPDTWFQKQDFDFNVTFQADLSK